MFGLQGEGGFEICNKYKNRGFQETIHNLSIYIISSASTTLPHPNLVSLSFQDH